MESRTCQRLLGEVYQKGKAISVAQANDVDAVIDPAETRDWIVRGITQTVQYFTGLRGMNAAYDAVDDILTNWE